MFDLGWDASSMVWLTSRDPLWHQTSCSLHFNPGTRACLSPFTERRHRAVHGEIQHPPNFSVSPTLAPSAVNWRWVGVGEAFAFPLQGFSEWMWGGRGGTRRFVFIRSSFKSANEITCRSLSKWWSNYEMLLSPIKKRKKKEKPSIVVSLSRQADRVTSGSCSRCSSKSSFKDHGYQLSPGRMKQLLCLLNPKKRLTEEKYYLVSQTLLAIKYSLWVGCPAMTCR